MLGALDKADGGAGYDTLNIQDTSTAVGADFSLAPFNGLSIKNIEQINVTTNGALGTATGTAFDVSTIAGLTSFVGAAAGAGTATGSKVQAAGTTDVDLTVAGANTAEVQGGKDVTVNAGTGAVTVAGNALNSVTVNTSGAATISSNSATLGAGNGSTLKSVTLNSVSGASTIAGRGVESLTLSGATTAASTVTVTNSSTTDISNFTINASGTGFTAAGAAAVTTVVHNDTKAVTVNLTGNTNNLEIDSTTATTLTFAGSGRVSLADAAGLAAVKTINGSAATGNLTLGTLNAAATTVSTGSGNDSLTLAATAKATVDTGAGNDTVTLASAVAAGSSINLGAGDDKLLFGTGGSVATSTATDVTTIDGGAGYDTVSASLINAANAARFVNFEALDLSAALANLDVELMTGSTIQGLTLSGKGAAAAATTVSNVAVGVGLKVAGDNTGDTATINVKNAATNTSDTFTVTFDGAAALTTPAVANVIAGTVVLNGIETVTIDSVGGANTWNSIILTDDKLKTLNITGSKNLDLTFAGTNGTNGVTGGAVSLIDGSAATGRLSINTGSVTADSATAGLTVKGGSGNDTITLAQKATVVAGAGDDTIVVSANGGTLTGGAGADKFDVAAATATGTTEAAAVFTTITDFSAGDSIKLLATAAAFTSAKITLDASVQDLDDALALALTTVNQVTWFNYGTDTYVVSNNGTAGLQAGDLVVKLVGIVDLTNATLDAATDYLTLA